MRRVSNLTDLTVDTQIDVWPSLIDMLTSVLMIFLMIYFVQHLLNPENLAAAIAQQKQNQFVAIFRREFNNELKSNDVRLKSDVNLLQITFGEGILFQPAEHDLQPAGKNALARLAKVFQQLPAADGQELYEQIQIEGHTDKTPMNSPDYPRDNWELSTARALAVLKFLNARSELSLNAKRKMSANGYADNRPIDRKVQYKNRRIEIRIYFSGKR